MFSSFLAGLDFPTRWSFLCVSKEINARAKKILTFLLQTKAISDFWQSYLSMRAKTKKLTKGFEFRGYDIGIPDKGYYNKKIDGKWILKKGNTDMFQLEIMVFHGYVDLINWFFPKHILCDGRRILECIGVTGHWQALEHTMLADFLTYGGPDLYANLELRMLVLQRGDTDFWNRIVSRRPEENRQDLEDLKTRYWLKRRQPSKRDASPKRK